MRTVDPTPRALRRGALILAMSVASAAATPSRAAVGWWTSQGPPGGEVADLALLAGAQPALLAATYGGVFRTPDGGNTWVGCNKGLGYPWIAALATDPADAARAYAATYENGLVYRSLDGGRTWAPKSLGRSFFVYALAVAPSDPARLYAGGQQGMLRSSDYGQTWANASTGLEDEGVEAMAVDPTSPGTVWVVTAYDNKVFRSTDGGATWQPRGPALDVYSLAIDPNLPSVLYAGTHDGVRRTDNGGETWSPRGLAGRTVEALAIDPANPQRLYAGTGNGLFRSLDAGLGWQAAGAARASRIVAGLGRVWAATGAGVVRSGDEGENWEPSNTGLWATRIAGLATIPQSWGVFAAVSGAGVFASHDGGATWSAANQGIDDFGALSIAAVPAHSGVPDTLYYGAGSTFTSVDHGATWTPLPALQGVVAWAFPPSAPQTLYAATMFSGVFRRTGGGAWTPINDGLQGTGNLHTLAIDPLEPERLWLGTENGVFRTVNGGTLWTPASNGLTDRFVRALLVDPASGALLAGTAGQGVFRSTDDGASWKPVEDSDLSNQVYALALGPGGAVYAGGNHRVAVSTDGGLTWLPLGDLSGELVTALAVDALHPSRVYAGGFGGGVWELDRSAAAAFLTGGGLSDFRFSVRITIPTGEVQPTRQEADCIGETVCVSGALPGRSELFLRIVGPKPNGYLWPTIVKFSTSRIEVWIEQRSKGITRYYLLPEASRESTDLAGFYDREGFLP